MMFRGVAILTIMLNILLISVKNFENQPLRLAMIFDPDNRNLPEAFLTFSQHVKFSGEGRIECPVPNKFGAKVVSTAWIAMSTDTVVSVAHAFYWSPSRDVDNVRLEPNSCTFVLYDPYGKVRDSIPISFAEDRWDQELYYNDRSNDIAIIKLQRKPNVPVLLAPLPKYPGFRPADGSDIFLIAHHIDVQVNVVTRITRGKIYSMPMEYNEHKFWG